MSGTSPPQNSAESTLSSVPNRGVRRIGAGDPAPDEALRITNVGPQLTEWLPGLLQEILPSSVRAVRELVAEHTGGEDADTRLGTFGREVLQEEILDLPMGGRWEETGGWSDGEAEAAQYALDLFQLALVGDKVEPGDDVLLQYRAAALADTLPESTLRKELTDQQHDRFEGGARLVDVLNEDEIVAMADRLGNDPVRNATQIGTGRGATNAGVEALAKGPVRLHEHVDDRPTPIVLFLDGAAWQDLQDRETGARALATISALGAGFDVRVALSSRCENILQRRFGNWHEANICLTEAEERSSHVSSPAAASEKEQAVIEAWNAIEDLPPRKGKIRLLANLRPGESREVRDLRRDDEIGLSASSIDPYVQDLAERGLVAITDGEYNQVELTEIGEVAVERLITSDYGLRHPLHSRLRTGLTGTPQLRTSTVCRANSDMTPPATPTPAAEGHLADTGDPKGDAEYVQWLDGPSDRLDAWAMHHRLLAGRRVEGVTCVDHELDPFDDGRVAYLSCFDDTMLVATQWGKSLPTLARIAGALLSDKAMGKVLTEGAFGKEFQEVYEGAFEEAVESVIQRGAQIGWFSEDELDYDNFRERYGKVKSLCLERLGDLAGTKKYEERQDLYRDLHGLLASATHLYNAAGIDVTINIRMPDTYQLLADEKRYGDFLDFFQYTAPKNAVYGCHSLYRLLLEDDPEKLRARLPCEVSPEDPMADLTASWVVSGPDATLLTEDIQEAIEREADNVREQILNGNEEAPVLEVPVVEGNSYAAIKNVIEEYAEKKDFRSEAIRDVRRLVRVCIATLGSEDRGASPYDVAEMMLSIGRQRGGDVLTVDDIAYGLSQLPAERLLPDLPKTAREMVSVLLGAENPLGRSEIIDRAGISGSSYGRHIGKLAAYAVVEPTSDRKWEAHIEPWWAAGSDLDEPRTDEDSYVNGDAPPRTPVRGVDLFFWTAIQEERELLGRDGSWELFDWPPDYEHLLSESELFRQWATFVFAHQAPVDSPAAAYLDDSPGSEWLVDAPVSGKADSVDARSVRIGRLPAAAEEAQTRLSGT